MAVFIVFIFPVAASSAEVCDITELVKRADEFETLLAKLPPEQKADVKKHLDAAAEKGEKGSIEKECRLIGKMLIEMKKDAPSAAPSAKGCDNAEMRIRAAQLEEEIKETLETLSPEQQEDLMKRLDAIGTKEIDGGILAGKSKEAGMCLLFEKMSIELRK